MNRLTLALVPLCLVACALPAPFTNELHVTADTEDGFAPWSEGFPVKVRVWGTISTPLADSQVPIRVGLTSQTGANASRVITLVPLPSGEFSETVLLNASEAGEATAFAELAAQSASDGPFVIASGKLVQAYFERASDGGTFVGCVDLSGEAEKLVLEVDAEEQEAAVANRACDGTAGKRSVGISVPPTTARWRVKEASNALPALDLKGPKPPRTLEIVEDGGVSVLPDAGAPVVIRFRLLSGTSPLAFTPWRASVAPQGDGVIELSGSTDGLGAASLLLVAPEVSPLVVRFQSGRLEDVRSFSR